MPYSCLKRLRAGLLVWVTAALLSFGGVAWAQLLGVPPRPADSPVGSQLIQVLGSMPLAERENWIFAQVMNGNIPDFLRTLVAVNVNAGGHTVTYYATPDYLALGSDADYFLTPTTPLLGQRLCEALGCVLPTRKMVNQIWTNAALKLNPQSIPPSAAMITVPVFAQHNSMVWSQRSGFLNNFPLGALVAGDKKDVILSTKIYTNFSGPPKPVVIYGWHYPSGSPIQPLYNGHEETYADYSHGLRLVQNAMILDGSPAWVTGVLTNPALAALLSDEGAAEGSSDGTIGTPRYTVGPLAAVVLNQPRSQTVAPGSNARFEVFATGDPPPGYLWLSNGIAVPGATNASLGLTNLQAGLSVSYRAVVTNASGASTSRVAVLKVIAPSRPVLFADSFDADTATQWNLFWGAANGVADYTVAWAYDYGFTPYTFNGATALIPPAPNSPSWVTRAVRLTVNNNDTNGANAAVNLYPKGQWFAGDIALKFDLWMNYPGGAGGVNSVGSTEHAIFGINHSGTEVNWAPPSGTASDGIWFAVDGEGGTSRDYRAYVGNRATAAVELIGPAASGLGESNSTAAIFQTLFPATRFETPGSPGKSWVEVELRQTNNMLTWLMDGTVVAQRNNTSSYTQGNLMLGFMDLFSSIASPAGDAFVLFDNVRVEDLRFGSRFLAASMDPDGAMRLVLSAIPGRCYRLESSTNLADWIAFPEITASNAPVTFVDPGAVASPGRFYRARQRSP